MTKHNYLKITLPFSKFMQIRVKRQNFNLNHSILKMLVFSFKPTFFFSQIVLLRCLRFDFSFQVKMEFFFDISIIFSGWEKYFLPITKNNLTQLFHNSPSYHTCCFV